MKGEMAPYGDVDVVLAVVTGSLDAKAVADAINEAVGMGEEVKKCGHTYSLLTQGRYQVDLLFCRHDRLDFLSAVKANNDFLAFFGHILRY